MKTSIFYLGIALMTFTNVVSALDKQQSFVQEDEMAQTTPSVVSLEIIKSAEKANISTADKTAGFNPELLTAVPYQKTMEEIIAENNEITESKTAAKELSNTEENFADVTIEGSALSSETVLEDRIAQDSQIIEALVLTAVQPLALGKSKRTKL